VKLGSQERKAHESRVANDHRFVQWRSLSIDALIEAGNRPLRLVAPAIRAFTLLIRHVVRLFGALARLFGLVTFRIGLVTRLILLDTALIRLDSALIPLIRRSVRADHSGDRARSFE
jgi:hypothetical protein